MAMERWKAQEVLELLRKDVTDDTAGSAGLISHARGTI